MTGSNGLAAVYGFDDLPLDRARLSTSLRAAGFDWHLGFEPLQPQAIDVSGIESVPDGSLVLVGATSFSYAQRVLQAKADDLSSLYLVVLTSPSDRTPFEERAAAVRRGLPPIYRHVAILPDTLDEEDVARAAGSLVDRHRTDPESILLWILDDERHRFQPGGCWEQLIQSAESSLMPRGRLRVVCSLVSEEALAGAKNRRNLVSLWRERILDKAAARGTRVVMVTDNQFSRRDTHLGEMWAATVLQRLPTAEAFVASMRDVNLVRPNWPHGIWINQDHQLLPYDLERILAAIATPHSSPRPHRDREPKVVLSNAPVRAIALSSPTFSHVWPDLLSLPDSAILTSLHDYLVASGPLEAEWRGALWEALAWDSRLAEQLAADPEQTMSEWVAGLPSERREAATIAWRGILEPFSSDHEPARVAAAASAPRFTFLAVSDEWASHRGGLSTFNRELCLALARTGHCVQCLVASVENSEIIEAEKLGVHLLRRPARPGDAPTVGLSLPGEVPYKPDFIIGHGRITGAAARQQANYFSDARRVHFFHMAPEDIEPHKSLGSARDRDAARVAEDRMKIELDLSRGAALAVGVGPRLYRELATQLVPPRPPVHRFDPGLTLTPATDERETPPGIFCMVRGRIDDYPLKGLDLAAAALGGVAGLAPTRYGSEIVLLVRGVESGKWKDVYDLLRADAGAELADIRIRNYSVDPVDLGTDLLQASLVLMPSKAEGFGLVGLEAISAGTPLLISSRSGLAELLAEHGLDRGIVVKTTGTTSVDVPQWIEAIDSVLLDRDAAFARAAVLRLSLGSLCTWDGAVTEFVEALIRSQQKPR